MERKLKRIYIYMNHFVVHLKHCKELYFNFCLYFFFQNLNFLFCIGVQSINNVMVVSGEQLRNPMYNVIHIHYVLHQPLYQSRSSA